MRIICSRLVRTIEDLAESEFNFEIRYTPGKLNSAADALSRLIKYCHVPGSGQEDQCSLPPGLVLCGQPIPGGRDSLCLGLHRLLQLKSALSTTIDTPSQLRKQLVSELLDRSE